MSYSLCGKSESVCVWESFSGCVCVSVCIYGLGVWARLEMAETVACDEPLHLCACVQYCVYTVER